MAVLPMQSVPPPSAADTEWWKLIAATALGFLGSLVSFRTRFYALKRDIDDERRARDAHKEEVAEKLVAVETRIAESIDAIRRSVEDRRNSESAAELRGEAHTRDALNAIRRDNDKNHEENRDRLRAMRQQLIAMVQLVGKIARVTQGVDQDEVDMMLGRFLMVEVERAD